MSGLLGRPVERALERLGPPDADRTAGGERWLVWRRAAEVVRVRARPSSGRVASWTVRFRRGRGSLRDAAEPLGLWPAAAPDEAPPTARPLLRRPLEDRETGRVHSLTATARGGRIVGLAAFDEPPEWESEGEEGGPPPERRAPAAERPAPPPEERA